jgi:nucleotide-binding universal stress UspA family protein
LLREPIVVGYNRGKPAREALRWASEEAAHRGLVLAVLYAANYPGMTLPEGPGLLERDPRALDAAREVTARGVAEAEAMEPDLVVVEETVVTGPAEALVEASSRASMVVVGSRGRRSRLGRLLGSVSLVVAARARCPAVVVRRGHGDHTIGPDHRVVVGTDGSPTATAAVAFAAAFAVDRHAALEILCCTGDEPMPPVSQAMLRKGARAVLDEAVTATRGQHPRLRVRRRVVDGPPEPALVEASTDAGMLVVGSRGRGAFKGMVAGSVSLAVMHDAHCPVAVIGGGEG